MKRNKIFAGLIALVVLALFAIYFFFARIEPDEIGVRLDRWGDGVVMEDFDPGFHLGLSGVHEWHRLDRRTHFVTFSELRAPRRSDDKNSINRPPLEIRTDGNLTSVDVTVTYRIKEGEAHQIVAEGLKIDYRDRVTSTMTRVLREELAKLKPSEFVNTIARLQRADEALLELEVALADYHVVPESLLIRAVRFPKTLEAEFQETQLRQQLTLLETSKQRVEEALARTGIIDKETERLEKEKRGKWNNDLETIQATNRVEIAEIDGEALKYVKLTESNADAEYLAMVAEGDFALAEVEALRDELRNAALDTVGGRIYQARAAAENLQFGEVTLNSNDPSVPTIIDIDALTRLLVGESPAED